MAYTAKQIIAVIPGTGGNKTTIANRLGCDRVTVYNLIERYPTVREAYEQEAHRTGDAIESKALAMALEGNTAMVIYLLKVHPALRERYGPEVRKYQIEGNLDITLVNATIKALQDIGKDPAEVFNKLIAAAVDAER